MSPSNNRAARLVNDAIDTIEDYSERYGHEDPEHQLMLVQLLAGLCLATTLERFGVWRFLRTITGAVVIAIRYRGLVNAGTPSSNPQSGA